VVVVKEKGNNKRYKSLSNITVGGVLLLEKQLLVTMEPAAMSSYNLHMLSNSHIDPLHFFFLSFFVFLFDDVHPPAIFLK
jgi:hypothetical protein